MNKILDINDFIMITSSVLDVLGPNVNLDDAIKIGIATQVSDGIKVRNVIPNRLDKQDVEHYSISYRGCTVYYSPDILLVTASGSDNASRIRTDISEEEFMTRVINGEMHGLDFRSIAALKKIETYFFEWWDR